jgi:sec-independent protein translocase protein TatB
VFNLSGSEVVVILLLALVVLGPEKLPDAIRRFGRTYAELKKMGTGFQQEFRSAIDEPMREMRETADLLKKSADFTAADPSASAAGAAETPDEPARSPATNTPASAEDGDAEPSRADGAGSGAPVGDTDEA